MGDGKQPVYVAQNLIGSSSVEAAVSAAIP